MLISLRLMTNYVIRVMRIKVLHYSYNYSYSMMQCTTSHSHRSMMNRSALVMAKLMGNYLLWTLLFNVAYHGCTGLQMHTCNLRHSNYAIKLPLPTIRNTGKSDASPKTTAGLGKTDHIHDLRTQDLVWESRPPFKENWVNEYLFFLT
jgi:hypothetical protein